MSLFASNIGANNFVGTAGSGANSGFAVIMFEWSVSIYTNNIFAMYFITLLTIDFDVWIRFGHFSCYIDDFVLFLLGCTSVDAVGVGFPSCLHRIWGKCIILKCTCFTIIFSTLLKKT